MELIDKQFANDRADLDDVLCRVKEEQAGCDVAIKVVKDDMGGFWVEVWV